MEFLIAYIVGHWQTLALSAIAGGFLGAMTWRWAR
jgi:hypothetical protein